MKILYSTRSKLIASFLAVSLLAGSVSLLVGGQLLYRAFVNEATSRIRLDLNSAREIYLHRIRTIEVALNVTTLGAGFQSEVRQRDVEALTRRFKRLSQYAELDFAGFVAADGSTLCRIGPGSGPDGRAEAQNPIAAMALATGRTISGTIVLEAGFLRSEDPQLARRAAIDVVATPRSGSPGDGGGRIDSGLALAAAVPVIVGDETMGAVYGGVLLNRSRSIVDRVRDTVFQHEKIGGRNVGTTTIFLGDARISTNVLTPEGERAIGTRVSDEVGRKVLGEGGKWWGRAFVVSDWYITAYEPIVDVRGERVGMLYVGVLEERYTGLRRNAMLLLVGLTAAGIVVAIGLATMLERRIMGPIHRLVEASAQVSQGNFSPDLGKKADGEIRVLQKTFMQMLDSLRQRDLRIQAESESRLAQYEKQASVGKLAAGVAHEINNPLTGVLTYTHLMLRRTDLPEDARTDLRTIAEQTDRVRKIVKGLLDFSRQTRLDPEPVDVNRLVRSTVSLIENQALVKGIEMRSHEGQGIPVLKLDRNQMQSVILNILINALDATPHGGVIGVRTSISVSASRPDLEGVELEITDTGCGIPRENLDRLFDPFFTTKEVGKGTGLGLAVSWGIVERHGGSIRVQSEVGKGSTFTVWLPAAAPDRGKERQDESAGR